MRGDEALTRDLPPPLDGSVRLTPARLEHVVAIPGGRHLGVAEYGPVEGRPVLWFHGTPGGRHQIPESLRRTLHARNVRLVVVERPGYGESTPHLHHNVRGFGDDVGHLVDALGIGRFGVAALSGGGPYALGVGHAHHDRVVSAAILGGVVPHVGPEARPGGLIGVIAPAAGAARLTSRPAGTALGWMVQLMVPFKNQVFGLTTRIFPPGDRAVFAQPGMREMFLHDLIGSARGGLPGPLLDFVLFTRDWGFRLADLEMPVHFWHGDADPIVTLDGARSMAALVRRSSFHLRPGESHLGGFATATEAIDAIIGEWSD